MIAFLNVNVTRHKDGSISTKVYRKPSNTNIGIKPHSCQDPKTAISAFKGELCRCHRLCSSKEETDKAIKFVLDLYQDNGHDRDKLKKIADAYNPPTTNPLNVQPSNVNRSNVNHSDANLSNVNPPNVNPLNVNPSYVNLPNVQNKKPGKTKPHQTDDEKLKQQLFDILPFCDNNDEDPMFACITYIPEFSYQIKRAFNNAGINTTFLSAPKLKDILCSRNTTKHPKERKKGIYKYQCTCSPTATYIGQTCRSYEKRWAEHGRAVNKEQWHHSGVTQHHQHCDHFNTENFSILHNMQGKNKRGLGYNMRIREALEIRRHKSGPGSGLNEDMDAYVKTDIWDTVLNSMG